MTNEPTPRISTAALIEDDEIEIMLYGRVMRKSPLIDEVLTFQMAEDALDYMASDTAKPIDVIFLDINMPRMNGFEFIQEATQRFGACFASAVVVMLTSSLDTADRERASDFEVVRDYLNKPLTQDDIERVAGLLEGQ